MAEAEISMLVRQIEDRLFPGLALDVWERAVYWHLFRRTRIEGCDSVVIGLDALATTTAISATKLRDTLRSMQRKGCNARKQAAAADDFLRALYRDGLLSQADLQGRLERLRQLQAGELVPNL